MKTRRDFLMSTAMLSAGIIAPKRSRALQLNAPSSEIACQQYTWFNYYEREGKDWFSDMESSFKAFKSSGLKGYEPSFSDPVTVKGTVDLMLAQGVWADSLYVNSVLHDVDQAEESIETAVKIIEAAMPLGIKVAVTNPSPLDWNSKADKSDHQLRIQAMYLNKLGEKLAGMGVSLAYHNHDAEMRAGAREFHHMMQGTNPDNVKLCLDSHWIYRGAGDSEIALFNIVKHYGDRIVELHLRQSVDGIWSEVFAGEGDISHAHLRDMLLQDGLKPLVVLEQCVEEGTSQSLSVVEAHKRSSEAVYKTFEALLG